MIRSKSSPAVSTRRCLPPFSATHIACPSRCNLTWHRPGPRLEETLFLTRIHVSSNIHELWRSARLSGFGTALRKSANILSARVLV